MMINNKTASVHNTVISKDGTIINYQTKGSGPGLILIHGVLSMASNYYKLAALLGENFTVYSIERRGRGLSGPQGEDYSMIKECEDIAALQKQTQANYLFGHSYGGLIALEAARNNKALKKIAVYEPGVSINGSIPTRWMPAYQTYMAQKRYLDALAVFSIDAGPENAKKTPLWLMKILLPLFIKKAERQQMYKLLPANLLEHKEVASKDNSYKNYQEISADVLLLFGGKSKLSWTTKSIKALSEVIPHVEIKEFPGLDHFGPDKTSPGDVANALKEYL
jgi:pimeloyl-ACP methyl ester carboxylesterase